MGTAAVAADLREMVSDLPQVVTDLAPYQVVDGFVVKRDSSNLLVPVSAPGVQYAKHSKLGGQRLYLTEHGELQWLCFPFTNLHVRFVYNSDIAYHTRMNAERLLTGAPHRDYISPSRVLDLLFKGGTLNSDVGTFDFKVEVVDTTTGQKRHYKAEDFLADMLRGPAMNLLSSDGQVPNYLRPFVTSFGESPFSLSPPASDATSENHVFALSRSWPIWVNPTNFTGVTLFLPLCGPEGLGMPEAGLGDAEIRKASANYSATREQFVEALALVKNLLHGSNAVDSHSGEQLTGVMFHDALMPFVGNCEIHYSETISSNIFVVVNEDGKKVLLTPPAEHGNYAGITRFFALKLAKEILIPLGLVDEVREGKVTRDLLMKGDVLEVFRSGSASGVNFVNALVWYDPFSQRFVRKNLGDSAGHVATAVSEAYESVIRGYEVDLVEPNSSIRLDALVRFAQMCFRLELPEDKRKKAMQTFSPDSVRNFSSNLVLEGLHPTPRTFRRSNRFVGQEHRQTALRRLATNRC